MKGWFLPRDKVNDIVAKTIDHIIQISKQSHIVDIKFRLNGKDVWEEADWIKYLERVNNDE